MSMTAEGVLDVHARLADRMLHPSADIADFIGFHMRSNLADHDSTSYYPVAPHGTGVVPTAAHGAQMARLLGKGLADAVTYLVTAGMVEDMRSTYDNTMTGIEHIDEREIPSPAGFAWLDEPWLIGSPADGFYVRALSWEYTEVWAGEKSGPRQEAATPWPCVRISLWRHDDDIRADDHRDEAVAVLGPLVLTHTTLVPFGLRFTRPARGEDVESTASFLGLVHILWIFLGMELTSQEKQPVQRVFRRRALRSLKHAEVRVVLLRRIRGVTEPGEGQHRAVFWSCRWPVQGHYRHRERPADGHHAIAAGFDKHCAVCGQVLAWVRPYLKGPDGKPLRANDRTVMKLAR